MAGTTSQVNLARTYARHFLTARQYAQEAYEADKKNKLALALRELSDGLALMAADVMHTLHFVARNTSPAPRASGKRPTM